jgi:aminopeptidase N
MRSVVAHEVGHQWWGARVAHANYRNYWFVESLAEYFSAIWLENVFGPDEYMDQVEEWRKTVLDTDIRASVQDSTTLWSGEFPGAATQAAIYYKGPYAFHMLRQIFGDEKFQAALKKICMDLAAKQEIVTEDMRIAAEAAFGGVGPDGNPYNMDLAWFFDQWIRGAGVPRYSFTYDTRRAEDGTWIVEGKVKQQVVVGSKTKFHAMDDTYYRGMVQITVTGKDKKEYPVRFPVEGPETPFAFKVPVAPREVVLNKHNKTLAHDVLVGRDF